MCVWHSETYPFVAINIQTLIQSRLKQSCRSCDVRLICRGEQKVGSLRSPKLQKKLVCTQHSSLHTHMRRTHTLLPRARHCSTKETRASYHTPAPPREAFVVRLIPHRKMLVGRAIINQLSTHNLSEDITPPPSLSKTLCRLSLSLVKHEAMFLHSSNPCL